MRSRTWTAILRTARSIFGLALVLSAARPVLGATPSAPADAASGSSPALDEPATRFAASVRALREGRAGDAIAGFESLADQGFVDATASYDRGLAYAMRVRIGAERPGDLGRAAHGFEEARDLSRDRRMDADASRALAVVRSEVARRRLRAGEPADVEGGRSLARTLAALVTEGAWAALCVLASMTLAAGLFARWLGRATRLRVAGAVTAGVSAPALALAVVMTLASRHDRLTLREAVIVSPSARPTDDHGIAVPGGIPLPEGARVEVIDSRAGSTRVRFGNSDAWLSSGALRELARG